jgi:DNA mismatch endonuclease (patch repair protein)
MIDRLTREQRSALMARIRSKDTRPELAVRCMLHGMGYRFRLHRKDLPGRPDVVLPGRMKIIFIHGCYWHGHDCRAGRLPKTRIDFWSAKIGANRLRDARNLRALRRRGWSVSVVWECQTRKPITLEARLMKFLDEGAQKARASLHSSECLFQARHLQKSDARWRAGAPPIQVPRGS